MLEINKTENVLLYEGHFFAYTSHQKPCRYLYAEFIDGVWAAPEDSCDIWEAKVLSWEDFEKRVSTKKV